MNRRAAPLILYYALCLHVWLYLVAEAALFPELGQLKEPEAPSSCAHRNNLVKQPRVESLGFVGSSDGLTTKHNNDKPFETICNSDEFCGQKAGKKRTRKVEKRRIRLLKRHASKTLKDAVETNTELHQHRLFKRDTSRRAPVSVSGPLTYLTDIIIEAEEQADSKIEAEKQAYSNNLLKAGKRSEVSAVKIHQAKPLYVPGLLAYLAQMEKANDKNLVKNSLIKFGKRSQEDETMSHLTEPLSIETLLLYLLENTLENNEIRSKLIKRGKRSSEDAIKNQQTALLFSEGLLQYLTDIAMENEENAVKNLLLEVGKRSDEYSVNTHQKDATHEIDDPTRDRRTLSIAAPLHLLTDIFIEHQRQKQQAEDNALRQRFEDLGKR